MSGLFTASNLPFELQRDKGPQGVPSLPEMTKKAIQILEKNKEGFFLLIESKCFVGNGSTLCNCSDQTVFGSFFFASNKNCKNKVVSISL